MHPALPILLATTLALSGCSRLADLPLNPLNWFGRSTVATPQDSSGNLRPLVTADMLMQQVDGRVMVASVDAVEITRSPEGAIIRATGTADRLGAFNAQLVPVAQNVGTLVLAFRVEVPAEPAQIGTASARQVTVARVLSDAELAGIRSIRVQAATNARVSRR